MTTYTSQETEVNEQHSIIGVASNTPEQTFERTTHPDAQWFASPQFGLFIHWGISSVQGTGDLSWSMMATGHGSRQVNLQRYGFPAVTRKMTPNQYWAQASQFNPDDYDPVKWLSAAKDAGCSYAVLTTKHHDGFALWPSEYGEFSTKNHMGGRDLVGEFVEACRKVGLKACFYYSPPDWHFNRDRMSFRYGSDLPALGLDHQPVELIEKPVGENPKRDAEFRTHIAGQVEELLSRYGKVDMLWFDGRVENAISVERIRELQPHILINPRGHGYGDFATRECAFPKQKPDGWWEYCHIFNDGAWGYLNHEMYKPTGWALTELTRAFSWEGSFLLNVAPDAHGRLPEVCYSRLHEIGQWMKAYGHTLEQITKGPWPEKVNMPVGIVDDKTWYVYMPYDQDELLVIDDKREPASIMRMDTKQAVTWQRDEQGCIVIDIDPTQRTLLVDVLLINW
jgi:alpha-L-fucosidase